MNDATKRFIADLKNDIARWEKMAAFLEDPHTAIEDTEGRPQDKAAMAARYWALAAEHRDLIAKLSR